MPTLFIKLLLLSCIMDALVPLLLFVLYMTGVDVISLFKIVSVCFLLTVAAYHVQSPIRLTTASKLFLVFGIIGVVYGLVANGPVRNGIAMGRFVTYVYSIVVPLLAISFGVSYSLYRDRDKDALFQKYFGFAFYVTLVIIAIYFVLHKTGVITYWGLGTSMHYYVPFMVNSVRPNAFLVALAAVLLSGKRATLLNVVAQTIIYYSGKSLSSARLRYVKLLAFLTVIAGAGYLLYAKGVFARFEPLFKLDFEDSYLLLVAFSGRWEEVVGILKYLGEHPVAWLIGAGAGAGYGWDVVQSDYFEIKNYAHFTPMAYLFRFGIVFAVLMYGHFFRLLYQRRSQFRDPFYLCFSATTVASFFGANLLIDIMPWFFYGVVSLDPARVGSGVLALDRSAAQASRLPDTSFGEPAAVLLQEK